MEMSSKELVEGIIKHNKTAEDQFVKIFADDIKSYLRKKSLKVSFELLRNTLLSEVEEILQETFYGLFKSFRNKDYNDIEGLEKYVFRTAKNKFLKYFNEHSKKLDKELVNKWSDDSWDGQKIISFESCSSEDCNPEDNLLSLNYEKIVYDAIEDLDNQYDKDFVHMKLDDMTNKEIIVYLKESYGLYYNKDKMTYEWSKIKDMLRNIIKRKHNNGVF